MMDALSAGGCHVTVLGPGQEPGKDAGMLMSVGGDGTFLSASALVAERGIPVVGVNLGRLGFLSENRPEDVADAILNGKYSIEERTVLKACVEDGLRKDEQIGRAHV